MNFTVLYRSMLGVLVLAWAAPVLADPPELNQLFPAGAPRGETTAVTAKGSFPNWPVSVWTDREGLNVSAAEKKGRLEVQVADDAPPGVHWLRLYDAQGAAKLHPFVVGVLPELTEEEPNDAPSEAPLLEGSHVVNGKLSKRGDVDGFALRLQQGQTLVASLQANRTLASPMDAVLQVCDAKGFVLDQIDDARGLDPLLVFRAPAAGAYLVRAFAFPETPNSTIGFSGSDDFLYRLTLTTGGFIDHALPLAAAADQPTPVQLFGWNLSSSPGVEAKAAADAVSTSIAHPDAAGSVESPVVEGMELIVAEEHASADVPQPIEPPAIVSGRLETPQDSDVFSFQAEKGKKYSLKLDSRSLGQPLDAVLQVLDPSGKVLEEEDDASRDERDPALTWTAPADGEFRLVVRDLHDRGGLRFVYRLSVAEETPDYRLTLDEEAFVLTPGEPLEIDVKVERSNGFAEPISIAAEGLPAGATAKPAESAAKGDSSKEVKLVVEAEEGAESGPFRIAGRSAESSRRRIARFSTAKGDAEHQQAWLTAANND